MLCYAVYDSCLSHCKVCSACLIRQVSIERFTEAIIWLSHITTEAAKKQKLSIQTTQTNFTKNFAWLQHFFQRFYMHVWCKSKDFLNNLWEKSLSLQLYCAGPLIQEVRKHTYYSIVGKPCTSYWEARSVYTVASTLATDIPVPSSFAATLS